ncbi:hypothetical protein FRB90_008428 [Tulasnella sp. 427]|nr:hypothetical protein FRB90_008428 [Tulasnella sp. 427]
MAGITPTTPAQNAGTPSRGILEALRAQAAAEATPPPEQTASGSATPNNNNRSSATQTLITAWKNREANKQVLAATARDAMKKWGFALNKNAGAEGSSAGGDGTSTTGSTRPATPESKSKTYEQMRTEATERRNRDPSPQSDAGGSGERARTTSSGSTGVGALNASPFRPPSPKATTQLHTLSRVPTSPNGQHLRPDPAPFLSPEQPLDAEERMQRYSSGSGSGSQPGPVMRQPGQAAMMRIPGIHASHRGDVMALGSSPPPPAQAPTNQGESPLGPNTLGPKTAAAVQSVYRLFQKNPSQASADGSSPAPEEPRGEHVETASLASASDSAPKPEAGDPQPVEKKPEPEAPVENSSPETKPVLASSEPPPLPARRTPSPVHAKRDSASSASSFLKQIQVKDATRSGSVGGSRPSSRRTSLMVEPQKGGPDDAFTANSAESNVIASAPAEVTS